MNQILNPHILIPNMIDSIDFNTFFYRFRKAYYIIFQALITKKWMFEASNATFKIHVIRHIRARSTGKTDHMDRIIFPFPKEGKPYNETALTETVRCTRWLVRCSADNQNDMTFVHAGTRRSVRIEPSQKPRMELVRFEQADTLWSWCGHHPAERIHRRRWSQKPGSNTDPTTIYSANPNSCEGSDYGTFQQEFSFKSNVFYRSSSI